MSLPTTTPFSAASTAENARNIIKHRIRLRLILEVLHIRVEQISLGYVNVFYAKLVNKLKNASSDGGFTNSGNIGEGTEGSFILQDDAIELRNVQLVGRRTRRNIEGKPLPDRMERAILMIRDSIVDWTDESEVSETSRQVEERPSSSRVLNDGEDGAVEQSLNSLGI